MKAPLRLEHYFFTRIEVEVNKAFSPQESAPTTDIDVSVAVQLFRHPEDSNRFQVVLEIGKLKARERELPYRTQLAIVGQFLLDEDFEHDHREQLVQVNGASMLYSAAREMLLGLTARGPWPAIQLPSISFRGED